MLGLKLNHVSKRGHRYEYNITRKVNFDSYGDVKKDLEKWNTMWNGISQTTDMWYSIEYGLICEYWDINWYFVYLMHLLSDTILYAAFFLYTTQNKAYLIMFLNVFIPYPNDV